MTYTLIVSNAGPSSAQAVVFTDVLPGELALTSCAPSSACTTLGDAVTVTFASLALNQTERITLTALVNSNVVTGTVITNTAMITSNTPDSNATNNQSSVTTTVQASADLGIVKSDTPNPVIAGELLTYTLAISNAGPSAAQSVMVTDTLPTTVSVVACAPSGIGICATIDNAITVTFGTLLPTQSEAITVVVRVSDTVLNAAVLTNTATITSNTFDPNETNNQSTVSTTVVASADLSMAKSVIPNPVVAGTTADLHTHHRQRRPQRRASRNRDRCITGEHRVRHMHIQRSRRMHK